MAIGPDFPKLDLKLVLYYEQFNIYISQLKYDNIVVTFR